MSPSSRTSNLEQLREALLQANSELFLTIQERRALCVKIQGLKDLQGSYSSFDPAREKEVFTLHLEALKALTLKEALAFSLVMEDQAQALAPGAYPSWSQAVHLTKKQGHLFEMINPLLLKTRSPELFTKLDLTSDFLFLKDF